MHPVPNQTLLCFSEQLSRSKRCAELELELQGPHTGFKAHLTHAPTQLEILCILIISQSPQQFVQSEVCCWKALALIYISDYRLQDYSGYSYFQTMLSETA